MLERSQTDWKKDTVTLPGRLIKPEQYAHVLFSLTSNSKAYIAVLRWQSWFGPWRRDYTGVCGSETPLARLSENGRHELLIPEFNTLRSIILTIFYHDDSILSVPLGQSDRAVVGRLGLRGEARARLEEARAILRKGGIHLDVAILLAVLLLTMTAFVIFSSLGNTLASTVMFYAIFAVLLILMLTMGSGGLRPRSSRIGAGWTAMGWSRDDLRSLLKDVVVVLIGVALGLWFGNR
jgi:hypothetical protein